MTIKAAERIMGYSIRTGNGCLDAVDEDGVVVATSHAFDPRRAVQNLVAYVYGIHRRIAYKRQKGLCSYCGKKLNGLGEADHVVPRSKGRVDLNNLKICCPPFSGGCNVHRRRHGG